MYAMERDQTDRQFKHFWSTSSDPPLATTQQHVAWENASLRVECNLVRNVITLEDRLAVRIVPTIDAYYAAIVVPLSADGQLHLVGRYRYPVSRWSLEFPRFDLESGDDGWKDDAESDLLRQTGLRAERMSLLGALEIDPSLLGTSAVVILAEGCQPEPAPRKTKPKPSRTPQREDLQAEDLVAGTLSVTLPALSEFVRTGQITCGVTLAALSLYRATLR